MPTAQLFLCVGTTLLTLTAARSYSLDYLPQFFHIDGCSPLSTTGFWALDSSIPSCTAAIHVAF
jgi:hypothetical protein